MFTNAFPISVDVYTITHGGKHYAQHVLDTSTGIEKYMNVFMALLCLQRLQGAEYFMPLYTLSPYNTLGVYTLQYIHRKYKRNGVLDAHRGTYDAAAR